MKTTRTLSLMICLLMAVGTVQAQENIKRAIDEFLDDTRVNYTESHHKNRNPETGEMLFAHCTIPFNMVDYYELDTHFESGIGVGIRGYMKEGPVTIFKVSGDLSRCFIEEGELVQNQA